jgi:hypothetical protein
MKSTTAIVLLLLAVSPAVQAVQAERQTALATPSADAVAAVPFGVGERSVYGVSWGRLGRRGEAVTTVERIDTVRGRPTYHLTMTLKGGIPLVRVDDKQESWLDVGTLASHRFKQDIDGPNYDKLRTLDFYPAEMKWRRQEKEQSGPLASAMPLDDISFLFWARTLPFEVGKTYRFDRYWKADGNPVLLKVLRRDRITVPAGTYNTIVVQPIIKTSGLFGDGGSAEVHFSDNADRIIVMIKTKLSIANGVMQLEKYTEGEKLPAGRSLDRL